MKQLAILSVLLLSSGCAIREHNLHMFDNQRPATSTERAVILAHIKNTFLDPSSIRDAEVSNAATSWGLDDDPKVNICVSATAKNAFGAYTGKRKELYHLTSSGRIVRTSEDTFAQIFCDDRRLGYVPFTEAMTIAR
jgi:hypothetical protein